jgi:hypothetical protein
MSKLSFKGTGYEKETKKERKFIYLLLAANIVIEITAGT